MKNRAAIVTLTFALSLLSACSNDATHEQKGNLNRNGTLETSVPEKLSKATQIENIRWIDSTSGIINETFSFKLSNLQAPSLPYQTCSAAKVRDSKNMSWLNTLDHNKLSINSIENVILSETGGEISYILMKYDAVNLGWSGILGNLYYTEGHNYNIDRWETVDWCASKLRIKKHNAHIINMCKAHFDNKVDLYAVPILNNNGGVNNICESYLDELGPNCFTQRSCYFNFRSGYMPQSEFLKRLD